MKNGMTYLIYPGTCREALNFYEESLSGDIIKIQTFEQSPIEVSAGNKERIFDSHFKAGDFNFKASDNLKENDTIIGTNFALFVHFSDLFEFETSVDNLSSGGKTLMSLTENTENKFVMFTDKFNIQWMLNWSISE